MEQQQEANLASECEQLRGEVDEYRNQLLRTRAEFDNYRKRTDREWREASQAGKRDLLLELLDVVDNFERALGPVAGSAGDDNPYAAGITAIYRQLRRLLETNGVAPFESVGAPFDPERHEAVSIVRSDEVAPDHVADELRPGYTWNGKLLRPARVVVAAE